MSKIKFILFAVIIALSSCGKSDEEHAHDSLIGTWEVVEAHVQIVIKLNGGSEQISEMESIGDIGEFTFTSDNMEYNYFISENKSRNQKYTFNKTSENSGFTKVNVYTINTTDEKFRVRFGDETSDSHCEATDISLEQTSMTTDTTEMILLLNLIKS